MQNNKLENRRSIEAKEHWENIYQTKDSNEMSWYQENPKRSVEIILSLNLSKDVKIIDVGAGDSTLVDNLLALGFKNLSVLDISFNALEKTKKRLGNKADAIKWIIADLREFKTEDKYDIWHDRAVLHFLTTKEDIKKYVNSVNKFLKEGGYIITSAFSIYGPKRCSGLDVKQYSENSIKKLFSNFEHIKSFEEKHLTPWGASQNFICSVFRKREQ